MRKFTLSAFIVSIFILFSCSTGRAFTMLDYSKLYKVQIQGDLTKSVVWQAFVGNEDVLELKSVDYEQEGDSKSSNGFYNFYFEAKKEGESEVSFKRSKLDSVNVFEEEQKRVYRVSEKDGKLEILEITSK